MIRFRFLCCCLLALCGTFALSGCGGVPVASTSVTTTSSTSSLAGNWLLYGGMPVNNPSGLTAGLVLDIQVIGTQIVASARVQGNCSATSSFGITYSSVLSGAIAADGSFTISSPNLSSAVLLSVKGNVPTTAGGSWPGTYSVAFGGLGCTTTQTGAFTATPVAQVTGTYSGTGTAQSLTGSTNSSVPITLSLALQQGSPIYLNGTGVSSTLGLSGSLAIQGLSCFSKGTTSTQEPSELEGNEVFTNFTMDDGSRVELLGDITDVNASTISMNTLFIASGTCAGTYTFLFKPLLLSH